MFSITVEVFLPFLVAGFGMVAAGVVLDIVQHWPVFNDLDQLFILVPALLGLKGNLEMTLASRLSTQVPNNRCAYIASHIHQLFMLKDLRTCQNSNFWIRIFAFQFQNCLQKEPEHILCDFRLISATWTRVATAFR